MQYAQVYLIRVSVIVMHVKNVHTHTHTHRRAKLERNLVERRVRLPQLETLRWRVDVTIANRCVSYLSCAHTHTLTHLSLSHTH